MKLRKEDLEEEDLYDIGDNPFRNNYDKVCETVSNKHKLLITKDKELGLYILAPSKRKESICYPKTFSGQMGENVSCIMYLNLSLVLKLRKFEVREMENSRNLMLKKFVIEEV